LAAAPTSANREIMTENSEFDKSHDFGRYRNMVAISAR